VKYFGQEEIERLQSFNDTMLKAIAANQLDKWRVTQKTSEKNVETLAIELYSSIVQAHNVFATRNVGSTKRARISQQIHTRGRMYVLCGFYSQNYLPQLKHQQQVPSTMAKHDDAS